MAGAQEIIVSAPSSVSAGQQFRVQFEVNDKASNFRGPSFKGFSVLSGPNTSTSSSMSWINGQMSRSVTYGFSYVLNADQVGRYTIGAASCVVDGKEISSKPFTITVTKADPNANQGYGGYGGRSQSPQQQQQQQQPTTIDASSLYASATINKSNPYKGEEVIISYKIYTQVSLQQYQIDKLPGNKGFWSEDLSEGKQIKQYEETINGKRYLVAEIRRGALFGQEVGAQKIAPLHLDVLAMVPVQRRRTGTIWDLFDDPFFNQAQAVKKELSSNSLNINVRPLPPAPDKFSGAVGTFSVKSSLDKNSVKANEAITYRLTVSGHGNLILLDAPEIDFPKVFEVYDPKVSDKINRGDNGISGSRTFEWVLVPQSQGNYEIPAVDYVYFDPASGQYKTLHAEGFSVKVDKGKPSDHNVSTSKNDVKLLNSDINHIKTHIGQLHPTGTTSDTWQWILLVLPVAATVILVLAGRKQQAIESDETSMKLRRALKLAKKRLRNAEQHLADGNDTAFYEEIYKAVWGCLSDKYNIPISQLSRDTVADRLQEKGISQEHMSLIMGTLDDVDMARFAPGDPSEQKKAIYEETLKTIATI